jgi:hypothetical protein
MARVTVSEALGRHFLRGWKWGEADCCTSACNAFRDLWGVDPMAPIRGGWTNATEAADVMKSAGGLLNLAIRLAAEADLSHRMPAVAREGDIVLMNMGRGPGLGIALGGGRFAGKTVRGFTVVNRAQSAWGVR